MGTASEESGGFFPDILDMLDEIPILSLVSQPQYWNKLEQLLFADLALGGEEHPVRGDQEEQE